MAGKTRKADILFKLGETEFRRREMLDLGRVQQLPTYRYVIERCFTIKDTLPPHESKKENTVFSILVHELRYIWIFMNIPCLAYPTVRSKIKSLFSTVSYLKKVGVEKRKEKWNTDVRGVLQKLDNGCDIRSFSTKMVTEMETLYGVKVTKEDEEFYADNCLLVGEDGDQLEKCKRLRWCANVDSKWWKRMLKRKERMEREEQFRTLTRRRMEEDQASTTVIDNSGEVDDTPTLECEEEDVASDEEYLPCSSRSSSHAAKVDLEETSFPKIPVRSGYRTIDVNIMETLVVMESSFKVEERKCTQLLAFIANKIFGQDWSVETDAATDGDDQQDENVEEPLEKKRKKVGNLEFVLPSRPAIQKWVQQFSLLSLKDAATEIAEAREKNKVVNYGVDDTVKAAGNKRFDIKAAHITITSADKSRESFSTGFNINASHSGKESAKTIQYDIAKLAVLTGNTYESMINMVDFFMTDRAGDNDCMLDELQVEAKKRLKCNAHVVLCVDAAIEKVFKDTEGKIGKSHLITEGAAHVFSSHANSILYLGLIAIAKLVSPSHMKESISLYKDYTDFLKANVKSSNEYAEISSKLLKAGFKGFISNRFGRIGQLSEAVIKHEDLLGVFFEQQVNIHGNKLVLAVDAYLRSSWFLQCSKISCTFYNDVVLPIKKIIGIDEFKEMKGDRSWPVVKNEFERILVMLLERQKEPGTTGDDLLKLKCATEVYTAIERQLAKMAFFFQRGEDAESLKGAILTNLGCEGEFAYADNDLRKTGGAVSIETISNRHIVARNKLHLKDRWEKLSKLEKKEQWHWAKNSKEAKKVKEMEKEFHDRLESLNQLSVQSKIEKKKKEDKKLMDALDECKKHGGPVTLSDIHNLNKLTDDDIKAEASYYKKIMGGGSAIRFKHKVGNKFEAFTIEELRQQIRNVLQPAGEMVQNVDDLLKDALKIDAQEKPVENDTASAHTDNEGTNAASVTTLVEMADDTGVVGWWTGLFGQRKIGVVMNKESLQMFSVKRYGFVPDSLLELRTDWELEYVTENYHYEEICGRVVLILEDE